jgi:uncharacterized delta-60 repeat protein
MMPKGEDHGGGGRRRATAGRVASHRKPIVSLLTAALVTAALTLAAGALAAGGDLDSTFSHDGKVKTPIGSGDDLARGMAIDSQGRIVVAGSAQAGSTYEIGIARYRPNGALDRTFSGDGKVMAPIGPNSDAGGVAIDSQDRIVVAGSTSSGSGSVSGNRAFAIARYRTNGSPDPTFSGDGRTTTDFSGAQDAAADVAIDSHGRIVAGGSIGGEPADFAVARYRPNGSLDPAFSGDGKTTTHIRASADIRSLAIDSQDRVIAAGSSFNGSQSDFAIARYRANGSLDPDFSHDGTTITPFGAANDSAYGVTIDSQDRAVAVGQTLNGMATNFALARYRANGSLDQGFSHDGRTITSIGSSHDSAYSVAIDPQGRIVAAGSGANGFYSDFALARYRANGSLDSTFSGDGKKMTSFGSFGDSAVGVAIDAQARIVAAGIASDGSQGDFAVARYVG